MGPLAVDTDLYVEIWHAAEQAQFPVDSADTYNWNMFLCGMVDVGGKRNHKSIEDMEFEGEVGRAAYGMLKFLKSMHGYGVLKYIWIWILKRGVTIALNPADARWPEHTTKNTAVQARRDRPGLSYVWEGQIDSRNEVQRAAEASFPESASLKLMVGGSKIAESRVHYARRVKPQQGQIGTRYGRKRLWLAQRIIGRILLTFSWWCRELGDRVTRTRLAHHLASGWYTAAIRLAGRIWGHWQREMAKPMTHKEDEDEAGADVELMRSLDTTERFTMERSTRRKDGERPGKKRRRGPESADGRHRDGDWDASCSLAENFQSEQPQHGRLNVNAKYALPAAASSVANRTTPFLRSPSANVFSPPEHPSIAYLGHEHERVEHDGSDLPARRYRRSLGVRGRRCARLRGQVGGGTGTGIEDDCHAESWALRWARLSPRLK
ncbi:hypothetical protein FB451DRAFT_1192358 [Mycena latifolia]|nr:hypothetical protein FB451DRAFT_1192358 [Mycena latifolia]